MAQINPTLPSLSEANATADPKVLAALVALLGVVNGGMDSSNVADGTLAAADMDPATVASVLGLSQSSAVRRGKCIVNTADFTTSSTYALMPTPDRVSNIVLPTDGLITVYYQALWNETVSGAARAALFLGSNPVLVAFPNAASIYEALSGGGPANFNMSLSTCATGLNSGNSNGVNTANAPAGQGQAIVANGVGGACVIFATAGTYDVSVRFRATSGQVNAGTRKLWVKAESF